MSNKIEVHDPGDGQIDGQEQRQAQPKSWFHKLKGWIRRRFKKKRVDKARHPKRVEDDVKEVVDDKRVAQPDPWQNTTGSLVVLGPKCCECSVAADTRESIEMSTNGSHVQCEDNSSGRSLLRSSTEQRRQDEPGGTDRVVTDGAELAALYGTETSPLVMARRVDTIRAASQSHDRSVYVRCSEREVDPVRTEQDQSTRNIEPSQEKSGDDRTEKRDSFNGRDGRNTGQKSDQKDIDWELASGIMLSESEDEIRVIAEDSIIPVDANWISQYGKRTSKVKKLFKSKGYHKVLMDGEYRYVRKVDGDSCPIWSKMLRSFGLRAEQQNQLRVTSRPNLMAQTGREDDTRREVHKYISDQKKGRKREIKQFVCDPPLRNVGLLVRAEAEKWSIKTRAPIDAQSKRSSAEVFLNRHKTLKESFDRIIHDRECARFGQIDDSIFEPRREKPLTVETRRSMCQSVKHLLPLFKSNDITVHRSIARGGQGLVFHGECEVDNKRRQLAIKVSLSKDHDFKDELAIMRQIRQNDNVIRFFDIGKDKTDSLLVLEMALGDVIQCLSAMRTRSHSLPSMETKRQWTKSIVNGLRYVHRSGFVHNDLKLQNILIVRDLKTNEISPKISDFGHSRQAVKQDGTPIRGNSLYGTAYYSPPECLAKKDIVDMRLSDV